MSKAKRVDVSLNEDRISQVGAQKQAHIRGVYSRVIAGKKVHKSEKNLLRKYIVVKDLQPLSEGE